MRCSTLGGWDPTLRSYPWQISNLQVLFITYPLSKGSHVSVPAKLLYTCLQPTKGLTCKDGRLFYLAHERNWKSSYFALGLTTALRVLGLRKSPGERMCSLGIWQGIKCFYTQFRLQRFASSTYAKFVFPVDHLSFQQSVWLGFVPWDSKTLHFLHTYSTFMLF